MIIMMLENVEYSVLLHCYIAYSLPKSKCISTILNMVMPKFHSVYQQFLLLVKKITLHKSDSYIFTKSINLDVVIGY